MDSSRKIQHALAPKRLSPPPSSIDLADLARINAEKKKISHLSNTDLDDFLFRKKEALNRLLDKPKLAKLLREFSIAIFVEIQAGELLKRERKIKEKKDAEKIRGEKEKRDHIAAVDETGEDSAGINSNWSNVTLEEDVGEEIPQSWDENDVETPKLIPNEKKAETANEDDRLAAIWEAEEKAKEKAARNARQLQQKKESEQQEKDDAALAMKVAAEKSRTRQLSDHIHLNSEPARLPPFYTPQTKHSNLLEYYLGKIESFNVPHQSLYALLVCAEAYGNITGQERNLITQLKEDLGTHQECLDENSMLNPHIVDAFRKLNADRSINHLPANGDVINLLNAFLTIYPEYFYELSNCHAHLQPLDFIDVYMCYFANDLIRDEFKCYALLPSKDKLQMIAELLPFFSPEKKQKLVEKFARCLRAEVHNRKDFLSNITGEIDQWLPHLAEEDRQRTYSLVLSSAKYSGTTERECAYRTLPTLVKLAHQHNERKTVTSIIEELEIEVATAYDPDIKSHARQSLGEILPLMPLEKRKNNEERILTSYKEEFSMLYKTNPKLNKLSKFFESLNKIIKNITDQNNRRELLNFLLTHWRIGEFIGLRTLAYLSDQANQTQQDQMIVLIRTHENVGETINVAAANLAKLILSKKLRLPLNEIRESIYFLTDYFCNMLTPRGLLESHEWLDVVTPFMTDKEKIILIKKLLQNGILDAYKNGANPAPFIRFLIENNLNKKLAVYLSEEPVRKIVMGYSR